MSPFLIAFFLSTSVLCGAEIEITRPSFLLTDTPSQIIEGKIQGITAKNLNLLIEPFLMKEGERIRAFLPLQEGHFKREVYLFPGLNIITVSTPDNRYKTTRCIFLRPAKIYKEEKWGSESPITFIRPRELKYRGEEPLDIEGRVRLAGIRNIEVIVTNMNDLLLLSSGIREEIPAPERIDYQKVSVKNRAFKFSIPLSKGLNVIIAKPAHEKAGPAQVQLKVIDYERTSDLIYLEEPYLEGRFLIVQGKVNQPSWEKIKIKVSALVEEELKISEGRGVELKEKKKKRIVLKTIIDKEVKIRKDHSFFLKEVLPEREGRYILKYSLIVTAAADETMASRTLTRW